MSDTIKNPSKKCVSCEVKDALIERQSDQLNVSTSHRTYNEKLYVVTCVNNYEKYKRRYELFWKFKEDMAKQPDVVLYVIEIAFGNRPFMVTDSCDPRHVQLRTDCQIWHKENSLNLLIARLPERWKYVAWIDADIEFLNKNIARDTIEQLQHYDVVQMWQSAVNMGPEGEVFSTVKSFAHQYVHNKMSQDKTKYAFPHPGFAWACTREAFNAMGGLIDFGILGAGDHHMARAFIGDAVVTIHKDLHPAYRRKVLEFQERCERHIKRNIGYVKGTITHGWHGSFKDRKYTERWKILIKNQYNPDVDIKRDWQGLYILEHDKFRLRDEIRQYFRERNEDANTIN